MGTSRSRLALIAAISTIWPTATLPQQGGVGATQGGAGPAGGLQVDLGISSKLTVDDNFNLQPDSDGTSTILDNTLTFGLSSITGTQEFILTGSGVLRYANFPVGSESGFEDPNLRARYEIESANSRLTATGRYHHVDRDFLNPFAVAQEEQLLGDLFAGGGTRTTRNAAVTYETGINAPLGFIATATYDDKSFSDAAKLSDPELIDTTTDSVDATVSMKVSPVTVMRFNAGVIQYDAEDSVQTSRQTVNYSVGVTRDINPILRVDARIGRTEVDTDTTGGSTDRSGTNGALTLTRQLQNGSVYASFDSTVNQNGTRKSLTFGRDMDLKLGTLRAAAGLTETPAGSTKYNARIAFDRQMKSSDITIRINQFVTTNDLSEDVLSTRIGVNYGYDITSISRLGLSLNYGRTEGADSGSTRSTVERTNLRATYSYALTRDWGLTGGVSLRELSNSSATGDATSHSVFLTLDRNFTFRP